MKGAVILPTPKWCASAPDGTRRMPVSLTTVLATRVWVPSPSRSRKTEWRCCGTTSCRSGPGPRTRFATSQRLPTAAASAGDGHMAAVWRHPPIRTRLCVHTSDGIGSYCFTETLLPLRERGNISLIHEPYNYRAAARTAWSYNTGTRRVRLAPGYGYDQPLGGSNGLMIIDEDRLFNGAPDRYDWELIGKKEIIIPA